MTQPDFIIALFCRVDDLMRDLPRHPQAKLYPSEIVTLALLYAIKGGSANAYYHWLRRNWSALFPNLPERTRLFRLFVTHQDWHQRFLADPTVLGVVDSYGIELIHPTREGRSPQQIGRKGKSNYRWIVGAKFCVLLNQYGQVVDWAASSANVHDGIFAPLIASYADQMVVLSDHGFHRKGGDPANLLVCDHHQWSERMVVEQCFSLITRVFGAKRMGQRVREYLWARLGYIAAAFNVLVGWHGLRADRNGVLPYTIAEFAL